MDLGPGTWDLGPGTWDLGDLGPGTWELGPGTWDLGPGPPFGLEDKASCTSWMFNFGRIQDTIQATSFFPWWLHHFFQENVEAKGDLQKKNPEIRKNPRPD